MNTNDIDGMNMSIKKQCIMNQLSVPPEIQNYIKDFVFMDTVTSNTKKQKKQLLNKLNTSLFYLNLDLHNFQDGHWALAADNIQLQAVNCLECGEFIFANSVIGIGSQCRCL